MKGCGEIDNRRSRSVSRERLECEHMIRSRTCWIDFLFREVSFSFDELGVIGNPLATIATEKLPAGRPGVDFIVVVLLSQSHFRKSVLNVFKSQKPLDFSFFFSSSTISRCDSSAKKLFFAVIFICVAQPELKSNRSAGLRSIEVETVHIRFWRWIINEAQPAEKHFREIIHWRRADSNRNTIEWEITSFIYTNLICYYLISRRWWGGEKKFEFYWMRARECSLRRFPHFHRIFPLLTLYPGGKEMEESRIRIINNYCLFIPLFPFCFEATSNLLFPIFRHLQLFRRSHQRW